MVINNGGNIDNELEKNKKKIGKDIHEFKRDFVNDSLVSKNTTDRNTFINNIMTGTTIPPNIKSDIDKFYAIHSSEYSDIDTDKIKIEDLKRFVTSDFLKLKNSRENIKEKILFDYDISSEDYDKKLQSGIEKLSKEQIDNLINSDLNLSKFIEKDIKIKLEKRDRFKFFKLLNEVEIKKRLSLLSGEAKNEVLGILGRYEYNSRLSDSDIRILFSHNFLKKEEKIEFVHTFIPFITLEKAVVIGLLTDKEAREKKKEINEKILKNEGLAQADIDIMSDYINLSDLKIATKDINEEKILDKISEKIGFVNFEKDQKELSEGNIKEIIQKGPKSLFELSEALKSKDKGNRFNNLEKFKEGNFIEFTTVVKKDGESKKEKNYVKVVGNNEKEKKFSYVLVGGSETGLDIKGAGKSKDRFYVDFLNSFEDGKTSLDFFTQKEMEGKIETGELVATYLNLVSIGDLENNSEKRKQVQENYKKKLEGEIEYIEDKIKNGDKDTNKKLEVELELKQNELLELGEGKISLETLSNFENFERLLEKLDTEDPDGKNLSTDDGRKGLFKGMILKTEKGLFFEVAGIDYEDGTIKLINNYGQNEPPFSFHSFYEAFKNNKTKRFEPVNDFKDLISKGYTENKLDWKDLKDKWADHKFENGKLIAEKVDDGDETGVEREVEYLVSDTSDEIIKICSTSGGMVEIQRGTRENITRRPEEEWKNYKTELDTYKKPKGEILYIKGAEHQNISVTELNNYIKELGLYPNWQTGKAIKKKTPKGLQNKYKKNLPSMIFSNYSVSEMILGGKMFIESFKETLKKGNEIHSAKFALRMGKLLPGDLKRDLQIKVENAEKTEMDKEIEDLGKVDSPIAIERILKWLHNKDVSEHKKEAAMLFMLEKYGHLSAKTKELYAFRGKWLWYEAFGGRINDKFFLEIKKRCEETGVSFSEEFLMLHLLKQQCKEKGFNGIHRRTRLHKEYEHKWSTGVDAEFDKGYGDANKKRTAKEMVYEGMLEAISGTSSNSVGWFKKAIERGGSLEDMSEGFFCLLYAGVFKHIDQKTFVKIKALWDGEGLGIIMSRFASSTGEMNIFNDTVLHLSKRIETLYSPKYSGIGKEAQEIYDDVKNGVEESKILKKTQIFWYKYSKVLVGALNMVNTGDSTFSKTNKIIFLEKDGDGPQAEVFNKYYNKVKGYCTEEHALKSDYMNDGLKKAGVTGLDVHQMARRFLNLGTQGGYKDDITGNHVWDEIYSDISNINNKRLVNDDKSNEENILAKKKYLLETMKDLVSGLLTSADIRLLSYNSNSLNIGKFFNTVGLHIKNDFGDVYSKDEILKGKANHVLMKAVNKIVDEGVLDGLGKNFIDPLSMVTEPTKKDTQNIVNPMGI